MVTIGNFDGVHRGHRFILDQASKFAESLKHATELPLVAVTFDPHPIEVIAPARAPKMLSSIEHRVRLLKECGASEVYVLAFDTQIAHWDPLEFVDRVLVDELKVAGVVVGENFHFGHKAAGDCQTLRSAGSGRGFSVGALPLDGAGEPWSSTMIREALNAGDVERADTALGRAYQISGIVQHGDRRGGSMGFPTANVMPPRWQVIPADGVYAGWLSASDHASLPAAISVGTNPTFDGAERRIESYVIDRTDLDLYGETVTISFVARIRDQQKFDSAEQLVEVVHEDVAATRRILEGSG